jgi:hypothetical protein
MTQLSLWKEALPLSSLSKTKYDQRHHGAILMVTNFPRDIQIGPAAILPHQNGLIIQSKGRYYVNGDPKNQICRLPKVEQGCYQQDENELVFGAVHLPISEILSHKSHPWGRLVFLHDQTVLIVIIKH